MSRSDPSLLPLIAVAGQATFEGCIAVLNVPRETLLSMLPSAVDLPTGDFADCPCLLVFGEQSDGTAFFGGLRLPWGVRYHELMVAIPFVRWAGSRDVFLFILGMACDASWAVWNGNTYYGFRKRLASMSWEGGCFYATDEGHQPGLQAILRPRASASTGQFAWIQAAAALPVLGHRDDGSFVRSRFEWDFREAAVEAAALSLVVENHFLELPVGRYAVRNDDAYWVRRMRWRLSWPTTANSL
jgi:hypothetical protein